MKHQKCNVCFSIILLFALIAIMWSCSGGDDHTNELSKKLQVLVDSMIDDESEDPIHNAVLLVDCPENKWKGAAGLADGEKEPMTADHKIKIASITKTFTATVILQLVEDGYLNLNDTINKFLDNPIVRLDSLHIYEGISYGRQITIEQLLSHTSGIMDYMEDPRFIPDVLENSKKQYSPAKILELYYRYQSNQNAVFPPGADFDYSDVNYVLLAMIIEQVTGESYHAQLRTRIFNRLGMENSYLEYYEEPRANRPLSHAFFSTIDLIADVNTSFDWGGSSSEEASKAFMLDSAAFHLGEIEMKNQQIIVLKGDLYKGFPSNGIIGYSIFGRYITEFDYNNNTMILHSINKITIDSNWAEIPLYFKNNNIPWVDASVVIEDEAPASLSMNIDYAAGDVVLLLEKPGMKFRLPNETVDVHLGGD